MLRIVEDAIDQLMQGDSYELDSPCMSDCSDAPEEEVKEDKKIEGLKVGFSVSLDFDLADLSVMESHFQDEEYVKAIRMQIRRKALEKLESVGADVPINISWTDPCIPELF